MHRRSASSWYSPVRHTRQPRFAAVQFAYGTVRAAFPPQSHGTRCCCIHSVRSLTGSRATSNCVMFVQRQTAANKASTLHAGRTCPRRLMPHRPPSSLLPPAAAAPPPTRNWEGTPAQSHHNPSSGRSGPPPHTPRCSRPPKVHCHRRTPRLCLEAHSRTPPPLW